ncbi:hypothetical protein Csa_023946, partial [Cucumis sativus]
GCFLSSSLLNLSGNHVLQSATASPVIARITRKIGSIEGMIL